jgi:hypothetical protein
MSLPHAFYFTSFSLLTELLLRIYQITGGVRFIPWASQRGGKNRREDWMSAQLP